MMLYVLSFPSPFTLFTIDYNSRRHAPKEDEFHFKIGERIFSAFARREGEG